MVHEWIVKNNSPSEVPYLNFFYHIYYNLPIRLSYVNDGDVIDLDYDDDDDYDGKYTEEQLDAMCGKRGECDDCPGMWQCFGYEN